MDQKSRPNGKEIKNGAKNTYENREIQSDKNSERYVENSDHGSRKEKNTLHVLSKLSSLV